MLTSNITNLKYRYKKYCNLLIITLPVLSAVNPVQAQSDNEGNFQIGIQAGIGFLNTDDSTLDVTSIETDTLKSATDTVFQGGAGVGFL